MRLRALRSLWIVGLIPLLFLVGCKETEVGSALNAKTLCSQVFSCSRSVGSVLNEELSAPENSIFIRYVNWFDKSGNSYFPGYYRKAIWRPGVGATLVVGQTEAEIRSQAIPDLSPHGPDPQTTMWPMGDVLNTPIDPATGIATELPTGVNAAGLSAALNYAFSEPDPANPSRRTRAVIIMRDGQILAEKYAPGFNMSMRLPGFSCTKSVAAILLGILAEKGDISLNDGIYAPEWTDPQDPRNAITIENLVRMTSGLEFSEMGYYKDPNSDINEMIFCQADMGAYAADMPLVAQPGTLWSYSSGNGCIISRFLRDDVFAGNSAGYYSMARRSLFDKLGMRSAIIELDPSGSFVLSAGILATARDYARFGQFCLQNGVWNGERIIPEDWMQQCITPTPGSPYYAYGAGFWLNAGGYFGTSNPQDMFTALGFQDQYITVIPSKRLVIVRLGLTDHDDNEDIFTYLNKWSQGTFVSIILSSLSN